eukprot:jgi/Bigna1/39167/e_gw1.30.46.1
MPYLVLVVRRSHIIEDTVQQLMEHQDDLKKALKVMFYGEYALDAGGVTKEFFQLLTRRLLAPEQGLFTCYDENYNTGKELEGREWEYSVVGMVLGLAIYNQVILDMRFPRAIYAKLLGERVGLRELSHSFPELASNLSKLLDYDDASLVEGLGLYFEVTDRRAATLNGGPRSIPLVEGGSDIAVTKANRREYVEKYADWILNRSIEAPFRAFQKGFLRVIGRREGYKAKALSLMTPQELECLICGSPEADLDGLEDSPNIATQTPVVQFFWQCFRTLSQEQKKRLLTFVTGSDRVPISGVSGLKMIIQSGGNNEANLPSAHTCFNTLILPQYKTYEKLREKLLLTLEYAEGFGLY